MTICDRSSFPEIGVLSCSYSNLSCLKIGVLEEDRSFFSAGDRNSSSVIAMGDHSSNSSSASATKFALVTFSHSVSSKLDNYNFLVWHRQILPTIKGHHLKDFLSSSVDPPSKFFSPQDAVLGRVNPAFQEWE